uniref:Uncharacterized protein n=1 Tax=Rhizophagus irregularis (strain DAOM 181602 / DAOM 197198 / MUCL 43194) TaxID=747089 RepID=U9U0X2_RHIID
MQISDFLTGDYIIETKEQLNQSNLKTMTRYNYFKNSKKKKKCFRISLTQIDELLYDEFRLRSN